MGNLLGTYYGEQDVKNAILTLAQKKGQVIYGAQATNIQLPKHLRRKTKDYDVLTSKPKQSAEALVKELNKKFGRGKYKVVQARYEKTFKVKDEKGNTIADYTSTTKKPNVTKVLGVKYADTKYAERKIKKILKDEASAFRHEKDIETLMKLRKAREIQLW